MYEPSPIEIVAPAPALQFTTAAQALAYYQVNGVKSREDCIILAKFITLEFEKINRLMDEAIQRMEADKSEADIFTGEVE